VIRKSRFVGGEGAGPRSPASLFSGKRGGPSPAPLKSLLAPFEKHSQVFCRESKRKKASFFFFEKKQGPPGVFEKKPGPPQVFFPKKQDESTEFWDEQIFFIPPGGGGPGRPVWNFKILAARRPQRSFCELDSRFGSLLVGGLGPWQVFFFSQKTAFLGRGAPVCGHFPYFGARPAGFLCVFFFFFFFFCFFVFGFFVFFFFIFVFFVNYKSILGEPTGAGRRPVESFFDGWFFFVAHLVCGAAPLPDCLGSLKFFVFLGGKTAGVGGPSPPGKKSAVNFGRFAVPSVRLVFWSKPVSAPAQTAGKAGGGPGDKGIVISIPLILFLLLPRPHYPLRRCLGVFFWFVSCFPPPGPASGPKG